MVNFYFKKFRQNTYIYCLFQVTEYYELIFRIKDEFLEHNPTLKASHVIPQFKKFIFFSKIQAMKKLNLSSIQFVQKIGDLNNLLIYNYFSFN